MCRILLFLSVTVAAVMSAPASAVDRYKISNEFTSIAFNHRQIFLVLHYTVADFNRSVEILTKKLSSHYLVPEGPHDGARIIYQLVPEDKRAWTQGVSAWGKRSNLNDQGIGIEIVNRGYVVEKDGSKTWFPFDSFQIESVIQLCKDIIERYSIKPVNVIGHADCAPTRKEDPGPLFPWKLLHDNGIGAWPDAADVLNFKSQYIGKNIDVKTYQEALKKYGYEITIDGKGGKETTAVVSRFQMHFRNSNFDGVMDLETFAILKALLKKYR